MSNKNLPHLNTGDLGVRSQGFSVIYQITDAAAVDVAIPADIDGADVCAIFACRSDFYINLESTATTPAGDVTDGSATLLNPAALKIPSNLSTFSALGTCTDYLHIEFFKTP